MEGLSGDIPFWIAPYDVKAEQQVNTEIGNLVKKLSNEGIRALAVDLFELSCELVEEHIGLEDMFALEQNMEKLFSSMPCSPPSTSTSVSSPPSVNA